MGKYTQDAAKLLELVGGQGKHRSSQPLHDQNALRSE